MDEALYSYWLEVQEDGTLHACTEYLGGYYTQYEVNATIDIDNEVYFIRLYDNQ